MMDVMSQVLLMPPSLALCICRQEESMHDAGMLMLVLQHVYKGGRPNSILMMG